MAWTDNLFRWLGFGRYNSAPPTLAEGEVQELQLDASGRLRVAIDGALAALSARYYASPSAASDGAAVDLLADAYGRARVVLEGGLEKVIAAADFRPPSGTSPDPSAKQRLSASGTTEAGNTVAFTTNAMATLMVGKVAVRVNWSGVAPTGSDVDASTDLYLPPGARIDWQVQSGFDVHVIVEADDGSSTYEAWCWTSSGARA